MRRLLLAAIALGAALTACHRDQVMGLDAHPATVTRLDFGTLPVGSRKVVALSVTNQGQVQLQIGDARVAEPFGIDSQPTLPVDPGDQGDVLVAFEPLTAGEVNTTLTVATSSIAQPMLSVELHGLAYRTDVGASPTRLDFGDVNVGDFKTLQLTVTNLSPVPLSPRLDASAEGDFVASPVGSLGELPPNGQATVTVTFAPGAAGPALGYLALGCATCPARQVELSGNGVGASPPPPPPPPDAGAADAGAADAGSGTPDGGDTDAGPPPPQAACVLAISPDRIDFPATPAGGSANGTVTVTSQGTAACVVAMPYFDSTSDQAFSAAGRKQLELAPGTSTSLRVDYAPTAATPSQVSGALVFDSNDKANPSQSVALSAAVQPPPPPPGVLSVRPTSLSFTAQAPSAPPTQDLTLANTGGTAFTWTGSSDDAKLTLSTTSGTLAPGAVQVVTVAVAGQAAAGARTQHLTLSAGSAGEGSVPVAISFTQAPPPPNPAKLVVQPASLAFHGTAPAGPPPAQAITISNSGALPLSWTAAPDDTSITIAPASGTLAGGGSMVATVSVAAQVTAGSRTQKIAVDAAGAGHADVSVAIDFVTKPPPPPPQYGPSVWPKFHQGNTLTGLSTVNTSGSGGNLRWRTSIGPPRGCIKGGNTNGITRCGTYVNSPSLAADGTVYQLAGDGRLNALDRASGKVRWATPTAPPWISAQESTPTVVADGSIFQATGAEQAVLPHFWKLSPDGKVTWHSTPGTFCGATKCDGWDSSPALGDDGILYLANDDNSTIDAFDATGRSTSVVSFSPHTDLETMSGALGQDNIGYWSGNGNLFAVSPKGQLWSFASADAVKDDFYDRKSAPALTGDGKVIFVLTYFVGGNFQTRVFAFSGGAGGGHELWYTNLMGATGAAARPGLPSGPSLSAADEADALKYRSGMSSPAIGPDGTIYVGSVDGLYALEPVKGRVKWSLRTAEIVGSPAVGADGRVYFGAMDGLLYCVQDGTPLWQYQTGGQVNSSPAIGADGTIYAASDDGYVYAVK